MTRCRCCRLTRSTVGLALWPLYETNLDGDIFMIELTPQYRPETPRSARNILNRINEIGSINGLVSELRALDTINSNVARTAIRMHVPGVSEGPAAALENEPSIKRTVGRVLFEMLRQDGHRACDAWLREHGAQLGKRSTVDIGARARVTPRAGPPPTTVPAGAPS